MLKSIIELLNKLDQAVLLDNVEDELYEDEEYEKAEYQLIGENR